MSNLSQSPSLQGPAEVPQTAGPEVLQGVGSVKRDCSIWEEFLKHHGLEYRALRPQRGGTKWDAADFKRITGWAKRTSGHGRDAAVLVFGV